MLWEGVKEHPSRPLQVKVAVANALRYPHPGNWPNWWFASCGIFPQAKILKRVWPELVSSDLVVGFN